MKKFDTKVQHLKYLVLREVARLAWTEGIDTAALFDIPKNIISTDTATMRCCVYKERAIIAERVKLAVGGDKNNSNIIEVIDIACDECPMGGYTVTDACRGCLARRCADVCPKGAIAFGKNYTASIDKSKCVECGLCARVCPYGAISDFKRPCERACRANAISMNEKKAAKIDESKCVACGACVYQCPWGAIMDKSDILNAINIIKNGKNGGQGRVYAVVAPSVAGQFSYAKLGQVISGIKALGFHAVVEAALGADMTVWLESAELAKKGKLTSSCCPAFVDYVDKHFPKLKEFVSENLSPMAAIAKHIKNGDKTAKVIFIGPCTAKKAEVKKPNVAPFVDCAITFEELQALFDGKGIDITTLNEEVLDNASYFGRIFARSGGLSDAVAEAIREREIDFELKPHLCDGLEECKTALLRLSKNALDANFIEGMSCQGGCINGAGCLTHGPKNKAEVDKYGREAYEKTISDAIKVLVINDNGR